MSEQSISTGEATKAAAEHKINDEQVRLYLLNLQDRLRLIEATVNTSASALISDEYDKLIGDVAQVLYELASRKLDDEIKKLAGLVKAWGGDERTGEPPPAESQPSAQSACARARPIWQVRTTHRRCVVQALASPIIAESWCWASPGPSSPRTLVHARRRCLLSTAIDRDGATQNAMDKRCNVAH